MKKLKIIVVALLLLAMGGCVVVPRGGYRGYHGNYHR
jgi:hypothetical protein